MKLVLQQATDKAIPEMFLALNEAKDNMVPEVYSFLNSLRSTIPGMDRLLSQWERAVCDSLLPSYDTLSSDLEDMVDSIEFTDPVEMVLSSPMSITDFLLQTQLERMSLGVQVRLGNLDTKPWRQVAVQYNSWASTREKLYGESSERIDAQMSDSDLVALLSSHIVRLYLDYLADAEILVRTTPNADMDPIEARVLGLE